MDSVPSPSGFAFFIFCLVPLLLGIAFRWLLQNRAKWFSSMPAWCSIVLLNLAALLLFFSATFLALETYYRFIYDATDSYNYTFASKRWFARYYQNNSAGLRDDIDYPSAIPAGKRRITFLGDSFTAAQGVKNVNDRFANILRRAHPEWDVAVLAVNGMDTGAEIAALEGMNSQRYPMDVVVLVYCLNDIGDLAPEWRKAEDNIFSDWTSRSWFVTNSYFADTFYYRLKGRFDTNIPNYFSTVRQAYDGPLWNAQQERLAKVHDLVKRGGGKFVVVTFPFLHALGPDYNFQSVHDQLGNFWRAQQVPHLDLLATMKNYPASDLVVNRLDAHPNERAHALAAKAIEGFLLEQLAKEPQPTKGEN